MDEENRLIREADGDAAQLRERVRDLETRLQRGKMESLGLLAGSLAHEINNKLTMVLSYSNMLEMELPPDSLLRGYAQEIAKAGDQLKAMAKTLQTLRVKPGHVNPVAAGDIVRATLDRLAPELGPDLELDVRRVANLAVLCEVGQLENLLDAFLRNARKAMPAGGRVVVTVEPVADAAALQLPAGAWARIAIRDEGAGMPAAERERMFEPDLTLRSKWQEKGLGLPAAYAAVCRAGGQVRVESEMGVGTEVQIFLRQANGTADPVS